MEERPRVCLRVRLYPTKDIYLLREEGRKDRSKVRVTPVVKETLPKRLWEDIRGSRP